MIKKSKDYNINFQNSFQFKQNNNNSENVCLDLNKNKLNQFIN